MSTLYTNIHKFLESANTKFPDELQLKVQFVYDEGDEGPEGLIAMASICAQDGDYSWPHRLNNVGLSAESALSEGGSIDQALQNLDCLIHKANILPESK